jgi:undecaprenyl diphosphate synthase
MAKKSPANAVPQHIGIIMDGNGRWAKKHLLPKAMGHRKGAEALDRLLKDAKDSGVKYITVYAFSTENWKRSQEEVSAIMGLLREYINRYFLENENNTLKVDSVGDLTALTPDLQRDIAKLKEISKNRTGINLRIAMNYGGRDELRRAVTKLAEEVKDGKLNPEDITEDLISSHLDTGDIPDPELIIRTSGEYRTSNFLLWQSAYSEYYFTDKLWPDFTIDDFNAAIDYYRGIDRRFGGRNDEGKK